MAFFQMTIGYGVLNPTPTRLNSLSEWDPKALKYVPRGLVKQLDHRAHFMKLLRESSDLFSFILPIEYAPLLWEFLKDYPEVQNLILFEMPYYVTNGGHPTEVPLGKRRLKLIVLKGAKYNGEEPKVRV